MLFYEVSIIIFDTDSPYTKNHLYDMKQCLQFTLCLTLAFQRGLLSSRVVYFNPPPIFLSGFIGLVFQPRDTKC